MGQWLTDGLRSSPARWDLLSQQVFFSQVDLALGGEQAFNPDAWDDYVANRDRIATTLSTPRNAVVLTGDEHKHWAAEVEANWADPGSKTVSPEFVTTSITSCGVGSDDPDDQALAENPHLKFYRDRELRADHRTLTYVSNRTLRRRPRIVSRSGWRTPPQPAVRSPPTHRAPFPSSNPLKPVEDPGCPAR
ncbi:alkaline phosphatase D family protein [Allosaccharopolyspora coralli]|nr:alkaline phosphatase D family protein [Allosaccharopolyspora coralli]